MPKNYENPEINSVVKTACRGSGRSVATGRFYFKNRNVLIQTLQLRFIFNLNSDCLITENPTTNNQQPTTKLSNRDLVIQVHILNGVQ